MRTIAVVTTSRADYGVYLPILKRIVSDHRIRLRLLVSGSHLSSECGLTVRTIERDGFPIADRIEMLLSSDSPEAIAKSAGLGLIGFAQSFARERPDLIVVLGDRYEMHAAAVAALPFRTPVAHIHGGELTAGAFDDALRHSMTKLSHLHFVATEEYAKRVVQLGEEPWRVTVTGAPSLDTLHSISLKALGELERELDVQLGRTFLLVTFHPATLDPGDPVEQTRALLSAVEGTGAPTVVTMPNIDPGGRAIRAIIHERAAANPLLQPVENVGTPCYFSLMALASAMVGNSSSGIIEAASFGLPVVNVGSRQEGRVRGRNVIDVACTATEIAGGISKALKPEFRLGFAGEPNPYGVGEAAQKIIDRIAEVEIGAALLMKRFVDAGEMPR